jgi:tyrosyl-tRNA synthetase
MVNNDAWLSELGYIDLLRTVGPHFTVNRMLTFDSVKLRLEREQPLTFLEFNYMILQAYDFRELALKHGVRLQLGGSDQWGNIVNGIELTRRMNGIELFGLTTPLLTTADGAKMGKSVNGAVWLNEELLPNYDFWQFWRNTDDRDVGRFLRIFTDLPLDEIARLEALEGSEINDAKAVLATEVTKLVRGAEAAEAAEATAKATLRVAAWARICRCGPCLRKAAPSWMRWWASALRPLAARPSGWWRAAARGWMAWGSPMKPPHRERRGAPFLGQEKHGILKPA